MIAIAVVIGLVFFGVILFLIYTNTKNSESHLDELISETGGDVNNINTIVNSSNKSLIDMSKDMSLMQDLLDETKAINANMVILIEEVKKLPH